MLSPLSSEATMGNQRTKVGSTHAGTDATSGHWGITASDLGVHVKPEIEAHQRQEPQETE